MEIRREKLLCLGFLLLMFMSSDAEVSHRSSTLSPGQSLSGNQTITSPNGTFELGFFTPDPYHFALKLGEGGFSSVCRGALPNSTSNIAVKALKHNLEQEEKQFCAEVRTLGTIQHVNLVRPRGFRAENSKRFLIYDLMPKGSLESHLFGNCSILLDWEIRLRIAIGIAERPAYLHEECTKRKRRWRH